MGIEVKKLIIQENTETVLNKIQIPSISIYNIFERSAQDFPEHIAVISGEKEISYSELKNLVDCFGAALYSRGFKKGERFGIMLPNSLEYLIAYFAIQRLGGIVVQVNPMYKASELNHMLRDSEVAWFICRQEQIQKLDKIGFADNLKIILTNQSDETHETVYGLINEGHQELPPLNINSKDDVAVIQYTGGTTGRSKGVMLTHYNIVADFHHQDPTKAGLLSPANERILGIAQLFHGMGISGLLQIIGIAGTYIPIERFQIDQLLELIRRYRPTILSAVPTIFISLLNHPDFSKKDLTSLKFCGSGAAPVPSEVVNEFEKLSGARIAEGYGLSEATTMVPGIQ
ncbi:acyl-CoA synthetase (AMP-forming)/AMP-acid ligase II [Neobacillus niacini]|uniref:AMP-binding protein n=1 Tax=Neobacillus niacini TaxID=86668 RepID=UPI002782435E|nr:AMP-binding protein [Neobacillus niacini]MDQ1002191.1 acyl-CoA synthetase (AMP-forming)/AMP-acid ligase II [Neobacillus niacini]